MMTIEPARLLSTRKSSRPWVLPSRGTVGMICLIVAEAAIFIIFFVSYVFYMGKSLTGPYPAQVLELPIFSTVCLLSSSFTVHFAVSALRRNNLRNCAVGLASTVFLGFLFLLSTAREWYHLIHDDGLTIRTNLFGIDFLFAGWPARNARPRRTNHALRRARNLPRRADEGSSFRATRSAFFVLALC